MRVLTCLLCLCLLPAHGQDRYQERPPGASDLATIISADQESRRSERITFRAAFAQAYKTYPNLPDGLLEALAFVNTRWEHLQPHPLEESHHHMPQAYGVMGFYNGIDGFADTLGQAAEALGVAIEDVIDHPRTNILAAAALLDTYIADAGLIGAPLEEMVPVIQRFSGLPQGQGKTGRYPLDSYAYDVLLTLDRGHDDHGLVIASQAIDFTRAFNPETLQIMKAPFIRMNHELDMLQIPGYKLNPRNETIEPDDADPDTPTQSKATVDYTGALWVASPNYSTRNTSISAVTIHTVQGSYAGCISWFQNTASQVSAHYVVRSSDGQITQMVRESKKAWHVGSENNYTVGIEHEGYVSSSSWYTTAMYNASSALTKDICDDNGIDESTTYSGSAHSGVVLLSSSYKVKGHQHYPNSSHTDPGVYWDWSNYHSLLNGGSSGTTTVLDDFESSEGHFYTTPTYSGSTYGISSSSTATRTSAIARSGSYSEQIKLVDNSSSSSSWAVRFLSGAGSTSNNTALTKAGGKLGFWVYSGGSGMSAALAMDDSDGTERSDSKSIPANTWTYLEWNLDDSSQWNAWYGGNGALTASTVSLDAIWFYHSNTSYTIYVYIDDVTYKN